MNEKFHYFLVAGQVTFLAPQEGKQPEIRNAMLNVLAPLPRQSVDLKALGAIQQQLQRALFQRLQGPQDVIDVVVMNVSHLGHMTKEEFGTLEDDAANDE